MYAITFITAPNVIGSGRTCKPAVQRNKKKNKSAMTVYVFKRKYKKNVTTITKLLCRDHRHTLSRRCNSKAKRKGTGCCSKS